MTLWIWTLVVALGSFGLALGLNYALVRLRNYTLAGLQGIPYDLGMTRYAEGRLAEKMAGPVAVVEVGNDTEPQISNRYGNALPGLTFGNNPRAFHAQVLRNLRRLGARVVVFDLLFDREDPMDRYFGPAIAERKDVILAALDARNVVKGGLAETTHELILPNDKLRTAAAGIGIAKLPQDQDKTVRRFEWWFTSMDPDTAEDVSIPALGVAAAAQYAGIDSKKVMDQEFRPRGTFLNHRVAWMQDRFADGEVRTSYIRFFGQAGSPAGDASVAAYEDVFGCYQPGFDPAERTRLAALLKDRIVLIGNVTDIGQDYHRVPVISKFQVLDDNQQMPGVEIQAAVTQTALSGRYVQQTPEVARVLLVLGVCIVTALIGRLLNPIPSVILGGLGLVALNSASIWLVAGPGLRLEPVTASVGLLVTLVSELGLMFFGERKARIQARRQLSRHVGPGVADRLAEDEWPDFAGEGREITMLFSDLQGFTSLSETMSSAGICDLLNRYFGVIFPILFKYGGTVDKLMGDGMMAYFGFPQRDPEHAAKAIQCAIEMQAALEAWQRTPEMAGSPPLRTRIGIHTGEATIGEIGYGERAEFTVIGDVVNVASRLEGMNKGFNTSILISEATRNAAGDVAPMVFRGAATVRGRKEPMPVYSVETDPEAAPPAEATQSD